MIFDFIQIHFTFSGYFSLNRVAIWYKWRSCRNRWCRSQNLLEHDVLWKWRNTPMRIARFSINQWIDDIEDSAININISYRIIQNYCERTKISIKCNIGEMSSSHRQSNGKSIRFNAKWFISIFHLIIKGLEENSLREKWKNESK